MTNAGYPGTPLPRKLGIKPGSRVALVFAPTDFEELLGPTDAAVLERKDVGRSGAGKVPVDDKGQAWDIVLYFATRRAALTRDFAFLASAVRPDGALWIAWPKRSSGIATDLTENVLRDVCLPVGMVDNKVCAIDPNWSGVRFVWRVENRRRRA